MMKTERMQQNSSAPEETKSEKHTIVVAGATGDLGGRIVAYLVENGVSVTALVRKSSNLSSMSKNGHLSVRDGLT